MTVTRVNIERRILQLERARAAIIEELDILRQKLVYIGVRESIRTMDVSSGPQTVEPAR